MPGSLLRPGIAFIAPSAAFAKAAGLGDRQRPDGADAPPAGCGNRAQSTVYLPVCAVRAADPGA